jgi:TolB-like protein/DNA-binding winged helix-turn-helix (wHTH) protein/tetratricopeptide (TPR) repeat protein
VSTQDVTAEAVAWLDVLQYARTRVATVMDSAPTTRSNGFTLADPNRSGSCQFGLFEVDLGTGELRRSGRVVRLAPQPTRVLVALIEGGGKVVTREELKSSIWGDETFVDFEQGLNFCIKQIRAALGDEADNPRFIETVPRRGYRFIAPLQRSAVAVPAPENRPPDVLPADLGPTPTRAVPRWSRRAVVLLSTCAVAVALATALVLWRSREVPLTASPAKSTIAVLPFTWLGDERDQDYFADGFTEELIAQLGRANPTRLGVIARTSTLSYRLTTKSAREIGRELGVQHLVEGTVRRSGTGVRINARLIRASDQSHVWAEIYEGEVRDILRLQRDVGVAIAKQIVVALAPVPAAAAATVDPVVYDLYLRGRYAWNARVPTEVARAEDLFREAVRRDPSFARAWAGLADALLTRARSEALEAAETAIALDDGLAEAHSAKATILTHMLRWEWAEREYRKAIALDPSYVPARYFYSEHLVARGRMNEALEQARHAMTLDPKSAIAAHVSGVTKYYAGAYDDALRDFRQALVLDPQHTWTRWRIGLVLERQGAYEAALAELTEGSSQLRAAYAHGRAGRQDEARRIIAHALAQPDAEAQAYYVATAYTGLGDHDEAVEWLARAVSRQVHDVIFMHVDPRFEPLRARSGYRELVRLGGWD